MSKNVTLPRKAFINARVVISAEEFSKEVEAIRVLLKAEERIQQEQLTDHITNVHNFDKHVHDVEKVAVFSTERELGGQIVAFYGRSVFVFES